MDQGRGASQTWFNEVAEILRPHRQAFRVRILGVVHAVDRNDDRLIAIRLHAQS